MRRFLDIAAQVRWMLRDRISDFENMLAYGPVTEAMIYGRRGTKREFNGG